MLSIHPRILLTLVAFVLFVLQQRPRQLVRRSDHGVHQSGFRIGMAGTAHELAVHGIAARLAQRPGQPKRRLRLADVIGAAVANFDPQVGQFRGVVQQLSAAQEPGVDHVMDFHDRKGNQNTRCSQIFFDHGRIDIGFANRQLVPHKGGRRRFPDRFVVAGQPIPVRAQQIGLFPLPIVGRVLDVPAVVVPCLRVLSERPAATKEVVDLVRTKQKDPPQQQRVHVARVLLRVRQGQGAAPASPQHHAPLFDGEVLPERVDVGDELLRRLFH
mmetsp:Transcript_19284/g.41938  ORF Transcript_19284/g.41938 Transcript_19284/m.41938 type:complete len:271 (+) Transcript_19284:357-1169(+)